MSEINYTCHSGGAPGSDMMWENEGAKYGVKTVAYSFFNHVQDSKNQKILTLKELEEGFNSVKIAEQSLNRNIDRIVYPYVRNLISRNWFQVKNSEAVFAIGTFMNNKNPKFVNGGTGWAVQMAIDNKKDIYFFNQNETSIDYKNNFFDTDDKNGWYKYNYEIKKFESINYIPTLTENFAGIGAREINEKGINAIKEVYKYNFRAIV